MQFLLDVLRCPSTQPVEDVVVSLVVTLHANPRLLQQVMGDKSTHNCILVQQERDQVSKADSKVHGPCTQQIIDQLRTSVIIHYLVIEVDFHKLPKATTVIVPDCFCISKGLQKGIC